VAVPPPLSRRTATGKELPGFTGRLRRPFFQVAFTPDGRRALTCGVDRRLRLWEVESGGELLQMEGPPEAILGIAFSTDGRRAVTGGGGFFASGVLQTGMDYTIWLWDLESGKSVRRLDGGRGWSHSRRKGDIHHFGIQKS